MYVGEKKSEFGGEGNRLLQRVSAITLKKNLKTIAPTTFNGTQDVHRAKCFNDEYKLPNENSSAEAKRQQTEQVRAGVKWVLNFKPGSKINPIQMF